MLFVAALLVSHIALAGPAQQPPRDRRVTPGIVVDESTREAELLKRIAASPTDITAHQQLAQLQENRGATAEAEATLLKARAVAPKQKPLLVALARFYFRQGNFDKTMEALETAERLEPNDPEGAQLVATYYWEKVFKDRQLLPADAHRYLTNGIAATDRALAVNPDYTDALLYKNLLLRMKANFESDPFLKQQLIAEADTLRNRALELNKGRTAVNGSGAGVPVGAPPPPPPPPPSDAAPPLPSGQSPVRVGGNIKTPTKVRDVRPVYPAEAQAARIQGVVIIEATIDVDGRVHDARVLRSVPGLDDAALDAVRQWEFASTEVDGVRVPVIMTVTVNFTLGP
jgi:TonB family protein